MTDDGSLICHGCYFCGFGSGLVVGGGALGVLVVVFGLIEAVVCTGDVFQSYADLTP